MTDTNKTTTTRKPRRRVALAAMIAAALGIATVSSTAVAQESDTTVPDDVVEAPAFEPGQRIRDVLEDLADEGLIEESQIDGLVDALAERGPGFGMGRHGHGPRGLGGGHLDDAAGVLGMDVAELRDALADGETLASLGDAAGVTVDELVTALTIEPFERIDQAVADGRIDATEAEEKKAEVTERVTALVNGEIEFDGRPGDGLRIGPAGHLEDAAEVLGMDLTELRDAVAGGETLASLADAAGVSVDDLVTTLTADAFERIDQAVADGDLEAADAEEKKADITERVTAMVNGEAPLGGPGPGHGRRGPGRGGPGGGPGNGAGAGFSGGTIGTEA